jgi:hypothetical protein
LTSAPGRIAFNNFEAILVVLPENCKRKNRTLGVCLGEENMQTFKNQHFEDRSFVLDETVFVNCKLKNCDLYYSGGDVEIANTALDNCQFHWRGPAKNVFGLLQGFGMLKAPTQQQLPVQVNIAGQKTN